MTPRIHTLLRWCFVSAFIVVAGAASYFQEIGLLLLPVAIVGAVLLVQYPQLLFCLLLISIPWSVEFNFNTHLATDLPDEPLMLLMSLSVVIWFLYGAKFSGRIHPLLMIILLQLAWTVLTVITSSEPLLSIKFLLAKCWYLLAFMAAPLVLFRDERILRRSAILLLTSMMLCMAVAVFRHYNYHWAFEKINDAVQPFFHNHVNYSALLVFMVPLQLAVIRLTASKNLRFAVLVLMVVTIAALYFSYARGAWLALLFGGISYGLLKRKWLMPFFIISVVVICAGLLWISRNGRYLKFSNDYQSTIFHKDFREHLIATYELKDVSTAERLYRWVAGVRMASDKWITGFGPTSFYRHYKSYAQPAFKTWVSRNEEQSTVHNYFLLVFIEQGLMGFMLWIALLAASFYRAQVVYHSAKEKFLKVVILAASAILVMECVINFLSDMIETDKAGSVFYVCVAVIIVADCRTRNREMV